MGFGLALKLWLFLRPRQKKVLNPSSEKDMCTEEMSNNTLAASLPKNSSNGTNDQADSQFLQRLPLEIRRTIYQHVWQQPEADYYYQPNGRHLSFESGRWHSRRCVMQSQDEDLDYIQDTMDKAYDEMKLDKVRECHSWLRSSWGHRHWRCERRMWRPATRIDKTDFAPLLLACKRMYPEVMQSIFESHKFMLNDIVSAHEFLVANPAPFVMHMRDLDLTLNMGQHHYRSFEPLAPEPAGVHPRRDTQPKSNWVNEIWAALDKMSCLHNLRIAFDVYDRGVWRKIPEKNITNALRQLHVLHCFEIELPPNLPISAPALQGQTLDSDNDCHAPFRVIRRPALRYWNFVPDRVERFHWETHADADTNEESCAIAVLKDATFVHSSQAPYNNPHSV